MNWAHTVAERFPDGQLYINHRQAVHTCRQALALTRRLGGRPDAEAAVRHSLGFAYHGLADYAQAVSCFGRSISLSRDDQSL